jgi:hypothetical protein
MVHNTRNYWALGLCPSSCVQKNNTREHDVSETGCVTFFRWRGRETPTLLGPLGRTKLSHCFSECRKMDRVHKPSNYEFILS